MEASDLPSAQGQEGDEGGGDQETGGRAHGTTAEHGHGCPGLSPARTGNEMSTVLRTRWGKRVHLRAQAGRVAAQDVAARPAMPHDST